MIAPNLLTNPTRRNFIKHSFYGTSMFILPSCTTQKLTEQQSDYYCNPRLLGQNSELCRQVFYAETPWLSLANFIGSFLGSIIGIPRNRHVLVSNMPVTKVEQSVVVSSTQQFTEYAKSQEKIEASKVTGISADTDVGYAKAALSDIKTFSRKMDTTLSKGKLADRIFVWEQADLMIQASIKNAETLEHSTSGYKIINNDEPQLRSDSLLRAIDEIPLLNYEIDQQLRDFGV